MRKIRTKLTNLLTGQKSKDDSGQLLIMILGYALIGILLITVVVSATSVHLQRKRLLAIADAAALDAADEMTGKSMKLTNQIVRDNVDQYLKSNGGQKDFKNFAVGDLTGTKDGLVADVHFVATAQIPLITFVLEQFDSGVPIQVLAHAKVGLG